MKHLKAVLARRGEGGGGILNEPISCCLIKASESKYSIDSFILSFTEGSFVVNDLFRNLTIPLICFTSRNIFAKRDAQRNRTNAARWKRCFLIDMNYLKWRLLGGGMGPIRNRRKNHPKPKYRKKIRWKPKTACKTVKPIRFTSQLLKPWLVQYSGDKWSM